MLASTNSIAITATAKLNNMARRSARAAAAVAAAAATAASGASAHASPVRVSGIGHRRPPTAGSADATIQALLRLPGFAWEEDLHW